MLAAVVGQRRIACAAAPKACFAALNAAPCIAQLTICLDSTDYAADTNLTDTAASATRVFSARAR